MSKKRRANSSASVSGSMEETLRIGCAVEAREKKIDAISRKQGLERDRVEDIALADLEAKGEADGAAGFQPAPGARRLAPIAARHQNNAHRRHREKHAPGLSNDQADALPEPWRRALLAAFACADEAGRVYDMLACSAEMGFDEHPAEPGGDDGVSVADIDAELVADLGRLAREAEGVVRPLVPGFERARGVSAACIAPDDWQVFDTCVHAAAVALAGYMHKLACLFVGVNPAKPEALTPGPFAARHAEMIQGMGRLPRPEVRRLKTELMSEAKAAATAPQATELTLVQAESISNINRGVIWRAAKKGRVKSNGKTGRDLRLDMESFTQWQVDRLGKHEQQERPDTVKRRLQSYCNDGR